MSTPTSIPTLTATSSSRLRKNAVGLAGVLFQSVTLIGPAVAVAFAFGPGITYAGGSFPLSLVLALIGCVLLALNIGQLAVHLPSAGSFYTFISRGLGRVPGFLAGWLAIPAYLLFLPLNLLAFGFAFQGQSGLPWWLCGAVLAVIMGLLTFFGVRLSVRTLVALGTIEIGVIVLLSVFLIVRAQDNTLSAFTFAQWAGGRGGVQGVLLGTVISFLIFSGFESAANLAEESINPRRIVPRAILLSVICTGAFFILAAYAGLAGYGFDRIGNVNDPLSYLGDTSGTPWFTLGRSAWGGAGTPIVGLIVLISLTANVVAGCTAFSRMVFAMGRAGALPAGFGSTHPRFHTPFLAILVASLLSIGLAVWSGLVYGPPPNSFQLIIAITANCVLIAYMLVSLAVPFFYWRERRSEWSWLRHAMIPAATIALLLVVLVTQFVAAKAPDNYPGPLPQYLGGVITLVWLVAGGLWVLVLRVKRPAALEAGKLLYAEVEEPAEATIRQIQPE